MQIRAAVLAALAVVPLSGCSSIWNCHPDTENFNLDQEVTAEQLDDLVARGFAEQDSWDTLACETSRPPRSWRSSSSQPESALSPRAG